MNNRNNGTKTVRNPDGTFSKGNPGRPKGARHKVTLAVADLIDGQAEAITQKAVEMALQGDTTALRLCLERIAPSRKDSTISFDLPPMKNASDAAASAREILIAVSMGELTPLEGAAVMNLVEGFKRILELSEYEGRIKALERAVEGDCI